ncbi:AIPR family protein [Leptospira sp. GIMC2001]|uniref:AIPR family protein n=1 Tax=Leptospira sp. GIMC2001 TaxID=1513297 RepID=UPI0004A5C612|nr:AIPR family protein [Leptospira sp. GIMC2001]AID56203.1 putative abortive infection phage resistance protein [Leptospira sp. GIMC2001]WCL48598.1 AIPR family protein [Leptospira sp. GIMC2001]
MLVTQKDLDQIYSKVRSDFGGSKDSSFALLHLSREWKKDSNSIGHHIFHNGDSLGINAYYVDVQRKNLYLYKYSWSNSPSVFKEPIRRMAHEGLDKLFGNVAPESQEKKFLNQIRSECLENQSIIQRVFVYFVFNGDPEAADRSEAISSLREDLENKKHLLDTFFQKNISLTIDFLSNQTRKRAGLSHTTTTHQYKMKLSSPPIRKKASGGEEMNLCILKLNDLYKMYKEMGQRLFERNIRSALSLDNNPNRAIRHALKSIVIQKKAPSDEFVFHHNGVTLFAEHIHWEDGYVMVTEPRVLNGAQTISSFAGFLEEHEGNTALESNKKSLESIEVLAKLITSDAQENLKDFVVRVTINTNRQNPVEPWNLRASDLIQLELADKFREELNIFYERQENAFESLSYEDLEEMGIDEQNKFISIRKLAQTFLAVQGDIDKISRLKEVFENELLYHSMFKKKYLDANAKKIMLVYKVQQRLGKVLELIIEWAPNKYYYIKRAKHLVWALLIQGILNDKKLDSFCEDFGTRLSVESNFGEIIKDLGIKKIKPLIADLAAEPKNVKSIEDEKFTFLKTKSAFDYCMKAAKNRYGWDKKDL